jgi:hypothetical protein
MFSLLLFQYLIPGKLCQHFGKYFSLFFDPKKPSKPAKKKNPGKKIKKTPKKTP